MFDDIYDIIVDKPKRGSAEVVGYENGGLVVLLDYGDGNIIKKLTAQGIINGTTWYPLKDFNQPTLDELRPTSGVGRLYGKVGFLKGTTNNGIFGIFDVEGIEIKALLEQPHHTALKVGVGTFSETRNPWVFEPPDEHVTSQEPVWLCPFQHADGSYKLASYGRMLYSGLDTFEWDGDSYGTPVSLPNKGYLFFDRFSTVLTEQDLQYEGGFANPSFVGTKYSELSGMFYEDFNFLDQVVNNYKNKLEHFYGTYVFSEGIGGFEYLLRYYPESNTQEQYRMNKTLEWFGTYVGRSFNFGSGDQKYSYAHMGAKFRARRLVFYDMMTEKFHLIPGAGLPWMIQLRAPYNGWWGGYNHNQNYQSFLCWHTYSCSTGQIRGLFVVNEINIDPIGCTVSMSGETNWLDEPIEQFVGDDIGSYLSDYAPITPSTINYLNWEQLPEGNIAMFDDGFENVIAEIPVTPGSYVISPNAWARSESIGNILYVDDPSVRLEYQPPDSPTVSNTSSVSDVNVDMQFLNLSIQATPFRPLYCISPPAEYIQLMDNDGYLYNIMSPDRMQDSLALAIPHIEWMSLVGEEETGKPKAIQTFLTPDQQASDKPNVEEIILDLSSIDLPNFERYKFRIYLKPGDSVMRIYRAGNADNLNNLSWPFYFRDIAWSVGDEDANYVSSYIVEFSEDHIYRSEAMFKPFYVYFKDGEPWTNKSVYWKQTSYVETEFDFDWCTELWAFRGNLGAGTPVCAKSAGNALDEDVLFEEENGIGSIIYWPMPELHGISESLKNTVVARGYSDFSFEDFLRSSENVHSYVEIAMYKRYCGSTSTTSYKTLYEADLLPSNRPDIRIPIEEADFTYCPDNGYWYGPAIQFKTKRIQTYWYSEGLPYPYGDYYSFVARIGGFIEQQYFSDVETAAKLNGWLYESAKYKLHPDALCERAAIPLPVVTFSGSETSISPTIDYNDSVEANVVSKVADVFAPFTGAPPVSSITGYLVETISQSTWYDCPNRSDNWYVDIPGEFESPKLVDLYAVPIYLSGFKVEIKKSGVYEPGEIIDVDLPSPIIQTPSDTFEIDGKDFAVLSNPVKYVKISVRLPIMKTKKLFLSDDMNAKVINIDKISGSFREVKWDEIES